MSAKTRSDDELAQLLDDVVMVSDRNFFARYPKREFRIRPAWEVEIEQFARADPSDGTAQPIADAHCWWTLVWQISPGLRTRRLFPAPHDLDPEPSEAVARAIWNRLAPDSAKQFREDIQVKLANNKEGDRC